MVGKPLVEASMTGLNSILMAYGQTGAGLLLSVLIFHSIHHRWGANFFFENSSVFIFVP